MSLINLPTELHLLIISAADPMALLCLRLTCTTFHSLIPAPTNTQLLMAETTDFAKARGILACTPCLRLLPSTAFTHRMISVFHSDAEYYRSKGDASYSPWRFCISCGSRPLAGNGEEDFFKYLFNARWEAEGRVWGRCARCGEVREGEWRGWDKQSGMGGLDTCAACEGLDEMERRECTEEARMMIRARFRVRGQARRSGRG